MLSKSKSAFQGEIRPTGQTLGHGQRPSAESSFYRDAPGFFSGTSNLSLEVLRVILFASSVIADFGSAPCNTIFCSVAAQVVVDSAKYVCGVNLTEVLAIIVLKVSKYPGIFSITFLKSGFSETDLRGGSTT